MNLKYIKLIVNWNAGNLLFNSIYSVIQYHNNLVRSVIIVDNASTDGSLLKIDKLNNLPFKLEIIRNFDNKGFGAACNQGAKYANSHYLLFLNPDAKLFSDSLDKSISFMEKPSNAGIGICGVRLLDENKHSTTSAANFPTLCVMAGKIVGLTKLIPSIFPPHLIDSSNLNKSKVVDQVIGAFFLIRTNIFNQCNGFDERFFVYFEEVDLSLRVKEFGYLSYYLSDVLAFHKGRGCSEQVKATSLFYSLRSRMLYAKKYYSKLEYIILILLMVIEFPLRIFQAILKTSWTDIKNILSAYLQLISYFYRIN